MHSVLITLLKSMEGDKSKTYRFCVIVLISSFARGNFSDPHSPASLRADMRWNSGSCSHFHIRLNVSRPDLSLLQGLGFRRRSERVPWERHKILWAKMACGMLYLFNSAVIRWATSLVLISSTCPDSPPCPPPPAACLSRSDSTDPFAWECEWLWWWFMPLREDMMPTPWPPKPRARCSSPRPNIAAWVSKPPVEIILSFPMWAVGPYALRVCWELCKDPRPLERGDKGGPIPDKSLE